MLNLLVDGFPERGCHLEWMFYKKSWMMTKWPNEWMKDVWTEEGRGGGVCQVAHEAKSISREYKVSSNVKRTICNSV